MGHRLTYRLTEAAKRRASASPWVALRLALLILAVAPSGCGLADYEERMREERNRIKASDEEKGLVGNPLDLPNHSPDSDLPGLVEVNAFLRPPKVFACKPAAVGPVGLGDSTALFAYVGSDNRYVLMAANGKGQEQASFARDVWKAFAGYLRLRGLPQQQMPAEPKSKRVEEKIPLRAGKEPPQPLRFDIWTWDEPEGWAGSKEDKKSPGAGKEKSAVEVVQPSRYWLCFYKNGNANVAAIFQVPLARGTDAAILRGIDASLKTLATGSQAEKRRMAFLRGK